MKRVIGSVICIAASVVAQTLPTALANGTQTHSAPPIARYTEPPQSHTATEFAHLLRANTRANTGTDERSAIDALQGIAFDAPLYAVVNASRELVEYVRFFDLDVDLLRFFIGHDGALAKSLMAKAAPEPASLTLLGCVLLWLGLRRRKLATTQR